MKTLSSTSHVQGTGDEIDVGLRSLLMGTSRTSYRELAARRARVDDLVDLEGAGFGRFLFEDGEVLATRPISFGECHGEPWTFSPNKIDMPAEHRTAHGQASLHTAPELPPVRR